MAPANGVDINPVLGCHEAADCDGGAELLQTGDQFAERHPQHAREQLEVEYRDVPLTSFNAADKGPVQAALFGELSLRQAVGLTVLANTVAQSAQKCLVLQVHG